MRRTCCKGMMPHECAHQSSSSDGDTDEWSTPWMKVAREAVEVGPEGVGDDKGRALYEGEGRLCE